MTTYEILQKLCDWFSEVKLAGLVLPNGWFGRPNDNLHQLTWSGSTDHKVLFELDRQLLLIVTDPGGVDIAGSEIRVVDCAQVGLYWQEYGSLTPHQDNYGAGTVRFVARRLALPR